jgi:N-acetyldiaminopimelate deacetylase
MNPFVELRRRLHEIPEPGFAEFKTQRLILDYLSSLPQDRLEVRTWKTGVLARVRGASGKRTLAWRADMDGLPIEEETSYAFRSKHPGFMHACGHDMHMAIALGILTHFVRHEIDDHLLVVFQPAEEGPGGAKPMMECEPFREWRPDQIMALHIAPEYPVGTIAVRSGLLFANTSELFVTLRGKGGHAAFPHRANDMIVAGAHLITQLQTIVSRNTDPLDAAVITVGKLSAGTAQNIIAETARLEGTIRTLSEESMERVKARVVSLLRGIETAFDCRAEIDFGASYHQVFNDERLSREFMDWLRARPSVRLHECGPAMTGEDFGYFLKDIPGFMFWLGVDTPYGLHHAKLEPDEGAIEVAIREVTEYIAWKSAQPR